MDGMAIESYFETYFLQEHAETLSGFQEPSDMISEYHDGMEIAGLFVQSQSDKMMIASAQGVKTRGKFAVLPSTHLRDGDTVRRVRDGLYIKIIGDSLQSPAQAASQVKTFMAEVIDRGGIK